MRILKCRHRTNLARQTTTVVRRLSILSGRGLFSRFSPSYDPAQPLNRVERGLFSFKTINIGPTLRKVPCGLFSPAESVLHLLQTSYHFLIALTPRLIALNGNRSTAPSRISRPLNRKTDTSLYKVDKLCF